MQVSIPIQSVNTDNVYFVNKKRNTVIEGEFTKILYSTADFVMTGLFIYCPFITTPRTPPPGLAHISPSIQNQTVNMGIVKRLCEIERNIIMNYLVTYAPNKTPVFCLQNYLYANLSKGMFRACILKISGVWENKTHVGITLKQADP